MVDEVQSTNDQVETLASFGAETHPLGLSLTLSVKLAAALHELHANNTVHLEVDLEHVAIDRFGENLKLLPSTRSQLLPPGGMLPPASSLSHSANCAAPEQTGKLNWPIDHRADLYSAGVVIYYLLTGQLPFVGANEAEIVHGHLARTPLTPSQCNPGIPQPVSEAVMRLLAKGPAERYQSASSLEADLRSLMALWIADGDMESYEVGNHEEAGTFQVSQQLVGREEHLAVLMAAVDQAHWGEANIALVDGVPGIGKSVLISEVRKNTQRNSLFISGKYEQYRRTVAYSAFVEAFEEAIHRLLTKSDSEILRWREKLNSRLGGNLQLIIDVIPDLVHITGRVQEVAELPPAEERNRFNRAFLEFVAVFASEEQPLILFLDDLQWADTSSLTLIEIILRDDTINHLLILGAYRSNEVDSTHALSLSLALLADSGIHPIRLALSGLTEPEVSAVVASSVRRPIEDCRALGALLTDRTAGNPFYVGQFLRVLHERNLLTYVPSMGYWDWNIAHIQSTALPTDAAEFVTDRLDSFPPDTCVALKTAACLGATFRTQALAEAIQTSVDNIRVHLAPAVRAGFVEPRAMGYAFVHDRIQQAAFDLIPQEQLSEFRYSIGRISLENMDTSRVDEALFELLDNLNHAVELPLPQLERTEVASMNLVAGKRARASLAYHDAVRLLRTGITLLPENSWNADYYLTSELQKLCFECEYLAGEYDSALTRLENLMANIDDELVIAHLQYTQVIIDTSLGEFTEAVAVGRSALQKFGIDLPENPNQLQIVWELLKAGIFLRFRKIESLENLHVLEDERKRMIAQISLSYCPAAYYHNPDIMILSALRIVNMSLRHGNPPEAAFGYVLMGLVLGASLGLYQAGYQFGKLALKLAERTSDISLQGKVEAIFGGFVEFWTQPCDQAITRLRDRFRLCVDAGDHQYANYAALALQYLTFYRGAPLSQCVENSNRYGTFHEQTQDPFAVGSFSALRQTVFALQGKTTSLGNMTSQHWVEQENLAMLSSNPTTYFYYQVWKLQLLYLCGELDHAQKICENTAATLAAGVSQICQVEQALYSGLVAVEMSQREIGDKRRLRKQLKQALRKLERWAKVCPDNFAAPCALLQAEAHSLKGSGDDTMRRYDAAIQLAKEGDFLNLFALANERAGHMYARSMRQPIAQAYYTEAITGYRAWGATRKADLLSDATQLDVGALSQNIESPKTADRTSGLDLNSIMKATRAIVGEKNLDVLLGELVKVTLEVAGAQRCIVVLDEGGAGWRVRACNNLSDNSIQLVDQPLDDEAQMCSSAVQFAARTAKPLVIADARADDRFNGSPYVQQYQPVSILILPMQQKAQVIGVIYLENNLTVDAFAQEKLQGLQVVASELAFALENARLLGQQQSRSEDLQSALRKVDVLQQAKSHLSKFVPQSVQRIIEENPFEPALEKDNRDVSILFLDIAGYTRMTEALDVSRIDYLIERYFSAFLSDIHDNGGDINETAGDGLMILFQDADPTAHAKHAARTALAIRKRTAEINANVEPPFEPVAVNIGMNSGSALVGSTRFVSQGGMRYTYTATGMVTNLAARIAASAVEGEILISSETARRLQDEFVMLDGGTRAFKNVSSATQVYKLLNEC